MLTAELVEAVRETRTKRATTSWVRCASNSPRIPSSGPVGSRCWPSYVRASPVPAGLARHAIRSARRPGRPTHRHRSELGLCHHRQRPERVTPSRRDPTERTWLRRGRPRFDQRHHGQRHPDPRRTGAGRRRHRQRRRLVHPVRGALRRATIAVLPWTSPTRLLTFSSSSSSAAVPVLRPRLVAVWSEVRRGDRPATPAAAAYADERSATVAATQPRLRKPTRGRNDKVARLAVLEPKAKRGQTHAVGGVVSIGTTRPAPSSSMTTRSYRPTTPGSTSSTARS